MEEDLDGGAKDLEFLDLRILVMLSMVGSVSTQGLRRSNVFDIVCHG